MDVLCTVTELSTVSSHNCTGSTTAVMKNQNIHIVSIQPEITLTSNSMLSVYTDHKGAPKETIFENIH